jgi:hypothetical protein
MLLRSIGAASYIWQLGLSRSRRAAHSLAALVSALMFSAGLCTTAAAQKQFEENAEHRVTVSMHLNETSSPSIYPSPGR